MKTIITVSFFIMSATNFVSAQNQNTSSSTGQTISPTKNVSFQETEFDFGQIKQGVPVTHNFIFQNNETALPIVIADVKTTCGCTTPHYPKQPILQGQKNQINIGYNAGTEGRFLRTVYVMIDGETNPRELVIKGEVIK